MTRLKWLVERCDFLNLSEGAKDWFRSSCGNLDKGS